MIWINNQFSLHNSKAPAPAPAPVKFVCATLKFGKFIVTKKAFTIILVVASQVLLLIILSPISVKGDQTSVVRKCLADNLKDKCKKDGTLKDIVEEKDEKVKITDCKTCDSDGCNGSNSLNIAMSALLLPLIASLVGMKWDFTQQH